MLDAAVTFTQEVREKIFASLVCPLWLFVYSISCAWMGFVYSLNSHNQPLAG